MDFAAVLHSVSYSGSWGQAALTVPEFVRKAADLGFDGVLLAAKRPHVSLLMRNRSGTFSVERLMDFLTALGHDVEIRVKRARKPHGQMSVVVAA